MKGAWDRAYLAQSQLRMSRSLPPLRAIQSVACSPAVSAEKMLRVLTTFAFLPLPLRMLIFICLPFRCLRFCFPAFVIADRECILLDKPGYVQSFFRPLLFLFEYHHALQQGIGTSNMHGK